MPELNVHGQLAVPEVCYYLLILSAFVRLAHDAQQRVLIVWSQATACTKQWHDYVVYTQRLLMIG